jgi:tetratricopeptide (TPR) repeat protein
MSHTIVKAWKEIISIPTYKIGQPDRNPMFLEKRVYQGSSGVVYPHPVIDKVYDEKEEKQWTALFLENRYLKVMILPELGGRIQMAYDKTNDYHFIYYNSVIKPALVGLAGPWISGGIEFNWPQHHRPSTFEPVDFTIEDGPDGSKTVWVNEYEKMFRTKCALGFTLYEDCAYIELHAKLYNRTNFPQTFLWWANPAVAVDEHYQSVFPPDVNAVFDHGKRDVSSFPIAKGTYYKIDYSPGTDISRYINIPVPTSYMAVNSKYDFVGGYHHQKKAGMLHVASHHVSPGKKQWTWGCGKFGKAWDRQLTDNDGPYFELMCGVFTDNQPDFSWIMPNEFREFKQYFMPYKNIGYVKNASIDAMVNFEINNALANIQVYVTKERQVTITLKCNNNVLYSEKAVLSPEKTFVVEQQLPTPFLSEQHYTVQVLDEKNVLIVEYTPEIKKEEGIPQPATAIPDPSLLQTIEELYLAGLHLEQYRHATYNPEDYYKEALRRDETDVRCNSAMGLLCLRRGDFKKGEAYFRKAIEKLTNHNPNPYNNEPVYNLGLCLMYQKKYEEAYQYLYKSAWDAAWQDQAYLQLSYIDCVNQNWSSALATINNSLNRNYCSIRARHLKSVILRKQHLLEAALLWTEASLQMDIFDFGSGYELFSILTALGETNKANEALTKLQLLMRNNADSFIEIAIDYANGGLYKEAYDLLSLLKTTNETPLPLYYMGYYAYLMSNRAEANSFFDRAMQCSPDRVFPWKIEDIAVLDTAVSSNPKDYKAWYYLGNFYYAKRRYNDAASCWEKSTAIYNNFATTHRNLGIAYFNKSNKKKEALASFEKAFQCDRGDSRVLFELDQLYRRNNKRPEERLSFLETHPTLLEERDDLYIEYILLHTLTGKFEQAKQLLQKRQFHPWEGGEGKTSGQHIAIYVELAKQYLQAGNNETALSYLEVAREYPENLGEGKLYGAQENDVDYWSGIAALNMGEHSIAEEYWKKASVGLSEPAEAIFYNDQQPDKIFYQGLAHLMLGNTTEATMRFNNLIHYGNRNMNKQVKIDYFAVSLPDLSIFDDDLNKRNNIHCLYLLGLGYMGLRNDEKAAAYFKEALSLDHSHLGAVLHLQMIRTGLLKTHAPGSSIVG